MPSRGYLQGLRPFHDPNLLLFLHSLPILYFVRKLYRNCSKCYALHLFWTHFVHEYKKLKKPSKSFILKRMTNQKSFSKPTAKLKSNSEAGLCLSVFRLASLPYSSFIKSSFNRCPFQILESCSCNSIKVFLS